MLTNGLGPLRPARGGGSAAPAATGPPADPPGGNGGDLPTHAHEQAHGVARARGDAEGRPASGGVRERGGGGRRTNSTKAKLLIASLNMRGYGSESREHGSSKWMLLNQLVRVNRIAVLALQEAHMNEERLRTLNKIFGAFLEIVCSPDPENETGARGVAFVVNKRLIDTTGLTSTTVIPGRAMLLDLKWSETRRLRVLNVYGPNDASENAAFWDSLREARMPRLDIMAGDFNVVEDGIDRIPVRMDAPRAVKALADLVSWLNMSDGWREENPQLKGFTYMQPATGSQSRLDRIYIRKAMSKDANGWCLDESGIPTDHKMARVSLADYKAPYIGKGRWAMPTHLLNDDEMKKEMKRLGAELVRGINGLARRTPDNNPQTIYQKFKEQLTLAARNRAKEKIPRMQKRLDALKRDLHLLLNPTADADGGEPTEDRLLETTRSAAILQDRIAKLEIKRFGWTRRSTAVKHWAHSETMSKQWIRANTTR
ncbi:DNase I-like protein, partial [Trametes versicolor FP-101664 SS1]|uniref:DNase I-like protein n=1 Tax=Trametes versicolor (strain FP-101664) TaxID=717944 RepID=UPI00046214BE